MTWEYLKREDFEDIHLPEDSTPFDALVAVAKRAASMYEQAKKKGKYPKKPDDLSFDSYKSRVLRFAIGSGSNSNHEEVISSSKNKRPKKKSNQRVNYNCFNDPNEIPRQLPTEFQETLRCLNQGLKIENEVLVIQKELSASDIRSQQNRFSIPTNHIMNGFLNEDERKILESREEENEKNVKRLDVNMIDTKQVKQEVKLARWVMKKKKKKTTKNNTRIKKKSGGKRKVEQVVVDSGTSDDESHETTTTMIQKKKGGGGASSISYVINGTSWQKIVDSNELKIGDVLQLWAVRVEGSLWFVLVKLD